MHASLRAVLVVVALASSPAHAELSFSSGKPGSIPAGWTPVTFGPHKRATEYILTEEDKRVVLHAHSEKASSGLTHAVRIDLRQTPILQWRWKISHVIEEADNQVAGKEDAPVRIVLAFEGDKSRLSAKDRRNSALVKSVTGRELPYAELVYFWSPRLPVGTIFPHPHSGRTQMVVATSGSAKAGQWVTLSRDVAKDFRQAFHEEPGALVEVGVLTDSDDTGTQVDAWYGDIRFAAASKR
jgi:Protein of unknown function (DUF3047)